jgi:hypothetical protein
MCSTTDLFSLLSFFILLISLFLLLVYQALAYEGDGYTSVSSGSDSFTRILHDHCDREKYRRRKGELKTVIHWGQRKLLLSEIEFLTNCGDQSSLVVYAGI